jgi:hypothetical protein
MDATRLNLNIAPKGALPRKPDREVTFIADRSGRTAALKDATCIYP